MRLHGLQEDVQARNIRAEDLDQEEWKDINGVLHHQGLPSIPEFIRTEIIGRHHDDPFAGHFRIEKTREFIARKYCWNTFRQDVEAYVKVCDVSLSSKAVRHKFYRDLQSLPIPLIARKTCRWILPISTDWKGHINGFCD